jgi:hypothetical protein
MFSDVISDKMHDIVNLIGYDYSYPDIYPPEEVINMLKWMIYVRMLSDLRLPDGTFGNYTKDDLQRLALEEATKLYESKINKSYLLNNSD